MAVSRWDVAGYEVGFVPGDATGALGDSVTVLPLVVALGALTPAPLGPVLLFFGVFQVVWGVRYGVPLSVEPMKALAGLAVAGSLAYGELVAAGLLAGGTLLVLGRTGAIGRVQGVIGRPVVRGVQLAVALLLARAGLDLVVADPVVAAGGGALAAVVALAGYRRAGALVVLAAGTVAALVLGGASGVTVGMPVRGSILFPAGGPRLTAGAVEATAAQLAMTVGNAAVATALLADDLYDADLSPDRLAGSMGAMTLVSVPLGGLPMCHGSGGLAGKHAFGARTAGANLLLGVCYVGAALVAGLWLAFPMAALGVLLGLVALELGRVGLDTDRPVLVAAIGLLALATNVGVAFLAGAGYWLAERRLADR